MAQPCNLNSVTPKTLRAEKLGSGRFGQVYKVQASELKRKKKCKIEGLHSSFVALKKAVETGTGFQPQLMELAVQTKAANIGLAPRILQWQIEDFSLSFLMEVFSSTVRSVLKKDKEASRDTFFRCCSIAETLHRHHITHGDLHLSNICYKTQADTELGCIDFGQSSCRIADISTDIRKLSDNQYFRDFVAEANSVLQKYASPHEFAGLSRTLRIRKAQILPDHYYKQYTGKSRRRTFLESPTYGTSTSCILKRLPMKTCKATADSRKLHLTFHDFNSKNEDIQHYEPQSASAKIFAKLCRLSTKQSSLRLFYVKCSHQHVGKWTSQPFDSFEIEQQQGPKEDIVLEILPQDRDDLMFSFTLTPEIQTKGGCVVSQCDSRFCYRQIAFMSTSFSMLKKIPWANTARQEALKQDIKFCAETLQISQHQAKKMFKFPR